jgi:CHASE2 domain-containing sensor protein
VSSDGPYVGLDYFGEADAGLFFGRDADRKRILGNLRASRLTLLYAESGAGKSSLLRAGVSARLRQLAARSVAERGSARYVPVVFSAWQGDLKAELIAELEAAVRPLLREPIQLALRRDALEGAIEDAAATVDATPLIILDQFEERFLYEAADDGFDDELADCINRRDLRANFLISVREDAYSLIGPRFKSRIANVYGNYLHLDFLDARAARDAVLEPIKAFNRSLPAGAPRYEVETALVDTVLAQVRRGHVTIGDGEPPEVGATGPARVETAYLQMVMKRLWEEETAAGSQHLRMETLRRLGGANTIVHGHLHDVMDQLAGDQRDAAAAAFRFLVTSAGRKIALSTEELREFSDIGSAPLVPALEHLERERILRPIPSAEPGGVARHELYHDVLAPAVRDWRRRHAEEQTKCRLAQARERARRLEVRNRRLGAAVIALIAVGVALALYLWNPTPVQRLELGTIDARFSVRGTRAADPRLVLVAVDDKTLSDLGHEDDGDIPRTRYAELLHRLRQDSPAVIALDAVFEEPADSRGDHALRKAIRDTGSGLVLACRNYAVGVARDGTARMLRPDLLMQPRALKRAGVRTGYRGLPTDVDNHNRRGDYHVELWRPAAASPEVPDDKKQDAPTFAFAAADLALDGALQRNVNDLPTASRRAQGEQSERTTWIDYVGPPGTIPRVSAIDLFNRRLASGKFAGRIVVVGVTHGNKDVHRTPLDGGRSMSDPEVQANAINTMLRAGPLRDVSRLIDILAILVLGCVPALASLSASRAVRVGVILGSTAVLLAVAQLAFHQGWILAVVLPLAALATSAAGVAVLRASRMHRRRLRSSSRPVDSGSPL